MSKFKKYLEDELNKLNFDDLFDDVSTSNEYIPDVIADHILTVIYSFEINEMTSKYEQPLIILLNLLKNPETKETLSVLQIMYAYYLLEKCKKEIKNKNPNPDHKYCGLYS